MYSAVEVGMGTDPCEMMMTDKHCQFFASSIMSKVILVSKEKHQALYPPKYNIMLTPSLDPNDRYTIQSDPDVYWLSSIYRTLNDSHTRVSVRVLSIPQPDYVNALEVLHTRSMLRETITKMHNSHFGPPRYQKMVPGIGPKMGNLVYKRIENVSGTFFIVIV
jgi:hypothetical protein